MTDYQNKCFITLVVQSLGIKRIFNLYTLEKKYYKVGSQKPKIKCLYTRFIEHCNSVFCHGSNRNAIVNRLLSENFLENYILKSIIGFIGGIILTYIFFIFLVFSLNFTLRRATYICMGLGVILSLGLAFSMKIRCTVFLCIPQLFSKRGRQALLAYAFILALSGPAKNTLHNIEVMSDSLACEQEELKQVENELLKCIQKPNVSTKKSIEKLLEKINSSVKYFKNFLFHVYRNCFDILATILHAHRWLFSISLLCNKKVGDPKQRCLNLLTDTCDNCESMDPTRVLSFCRINQSTKNSICETDSSTAVCLPDDIGPIFPMYRLQKKLKIFKKRVANIFYVKVEIRQKYPLSNRTSTSHEEYLGVATEIRQKTDQFLQYFDFMSVIFGLFILVLFVNVIIYRHKFLTEDCFDNRFITADFIDIDKARAEFQMQTILPLEPREKMKYIKVTSIRLVPSEKVRLLSSFVFLIFATFKIIIHMLTDSSLFWILSCVRQNERMLFMSSLNEEEPSISVHVTGNSFVAGLIQNVSAVIKEQSTVPRLDPTPCLPDPAAPDWNRYYQILALVLICWLFALCEPYGLRLRHTVMVTYHPERARERAIWLYNKIISNRISFLKLARRELRKKYRHVSQGTILFGFGYLRKQPSKMCLLCKLQVNEEDDNFVKCPEVNCVGIFCNACFKNLKFCSICSRLPEYDDLGAYSEEKQVENSSEEEGTSKSLKSTESETSRLIQSKGNDSKTSSELYLHIKKPWLSLEKELNKPIMTYDSSHESPIQRNLLFSIISYCRRKCMILGRELSDSESRDWNIDPFSCSDISLSETQMKKTQALQRKLEQKKIDEQNIRLQISLKKFKKKTEKSDSNLAICLFKKMTYSSKSLLQRSACSSNSMDKKESVQKPDFLFPMIQARSVTTGVAGDDVEKIENLTENVINEKITPSALLDTVQSDGTAKENCPKLKKFLSPSELSRNSQFENQKFIDEFYPTLSLSTTDSSLEIEGRDGNMCKTCPDKSYNKKSEPSSAVQGAIPKQNLTPRTPGQVRVRYKNTDSSSDSFPNLSNRSCIKGETYESDGQFYVQSFSSSEVHVHELGGNFNTSFGQINMNLKKSAEDHSKFYAVETDSTDEKFLSVKPSRRVCRKHKKRRTVADNSDFPNTSTNSNNSRKNNAKKVDCLKAELIQNFKTNLMEQKSSDEEQSSETEYVEKGTLFLSDSDFQKLSQKFSRKKNKEDSPNKKKSIWLSLAPDLLSDLPSSSKHKSSESLTD